MLVAVRAFIVTRIQELEFDRRMAIRRQVFWSPMPKSFAYQSATLHLAILGLKIALWQGFLRLLGG